MRSLFFILLLLTYTSSFSQKIQVAEGTEKMDDIARTGYTTIIELDSKEVENEWERQLKKWGKVESTKSGYIVRVGNIPEVSNKPCTIYSMVDKSNKGAKVWYAIDMGNSYVSGSKGAEKVLHDFAAFCYRDDINEQIKDAEKALTAAVKKQEKEIKEAELLQRNVERNKEEKAKLEQELIQNGKDLEQLKRDIEQNKTDQTAAVADVEKMKKAVEVVKQKMNTLE